MSRLPTIEPGDLLRALALASISGLGALPLAERGADPVALLIWISLCSLPVGALAGATRMHTWVVAPVVPALWAVVLVAVDSASERDLPSPVWATLAWTGLFAIGFGLGRASRTAQPGASIMQGPAGLLMLLSFVLVVLPVGGGLLAQPWPPHLGALLLDLSPATLLAECAGLDWMRHPTVYDAAGTAAMDPTVRGPYRGVLAAPIVLVVGCACVIGGDALARRSSTKP